MSRNYSSNAQDTTLAGAVTAGSTSLTVAATTGFPAPPFTVALDAGTANQELVLVTAVGGTTLTVERGYDSTPAVAHDAGAKVQHVHAAIDFREAMAAASNFLSHSSATNAHGVTGDVVGTASAQTLTNKTLTLAANTVTGTKAQFDAACSDADFATLAGVETLTNKTLTSPTVTGASSTGGTFTTPAIATPTVTGGTMSGTTLTGVTVDTSTLNDSTLNNPTIVNAGGWAPFTLTWVDATIGNATVVAKYRKVGDIFHFRVRITAGSTTTFRSGLLVITIPFQGAADYAQGDPVAYGYLLDSSVGASSRRICTAIMDAAPAGGSSRLILQTHDAGVTNTVPWTWATGDVISLSGTMELA